MCSFEFPSKQSLNQQFIWQVQVTLVGQSQEAKGDNTVPYEASTPEGTGSLLCRETLGSCANHMPPNYLSSKGGSCSIYTPFLWLRAIPRVEIFPDSGLPLTGAEQPFTVLGNKVLGYRMQMLAVGGRG